MNERDFEEDEPAMAAMEVSASRDHLRNVVALAADTRAAFEAAEGKDVPPGHWGIESERHAELMEAVNLGRGVYRCWWA